MSLSGPGEWMSTNGVDAHAAGTAITAASITPATRPLIRQNECLTSLVTLDRPDPAIDPAYGFFAR
jgi:hypothetical protein